LYHKANWSNFCLSVSELAKSIVDKEQTSSVEELWKLVTDNLRESIQSFIAQKTLKNKASCPWINKDLAKKIRQRDRAYSRCKRTSRIGV